MANHNVRWVLGVHVCFGNLDFVIITEEELVRSSAATQPLLFIGLNAITKALEELQLPTMEVHAPRKQPTPQPRLWKATHRGFGA